MLWIVVQSFFLFLCSRILLNNDDIVYVAAINYNLCLVDHLEGLKFCCIDMIEI